MRQCLDYEKDVANSGGLLAVEALEPVHTAATVRVRSGKTLITDGPFAETKEQLAGFFLVDTPNQNTAIKVAAGQNREHRGEAD